MEAFFQQQLPELIRGLGEPLPEQSPGSLVVSVIDRGTWFARIEHASIAIGSGQPEDCIVQLTVAAADFEALIAEPAARLAKLPGSQAIVLRPLRLDAAQAETIRQQVGTLLFATTGEHARKLWLTPGLQAANLTAPRCRLECAEEDFARLQTGDETPIELFLQGRVRSEGDLELPMVLSSLFF